MAYYNISEFLTLIKEDIGIKDLPLPVDDKELMRRLEMSALKEFSVRSPRIITVTVNDNEKIENDSTADRGMRVRYRIPKWVYGDSQIIQITDFRIARPLGYSDMYIPQGGFAPPDQLIAAMGDIRMAATMGSAMGKAPTFKFEAPDVLVAFNAWAGGSYDVDVAIAHDISLATIPPTAFTHLKQLCILDIEEFLYNKLKRIDNLDLTIGNIQLKIENWEDAGSRKADLLRNWDEDGANLDLDNMYWF